MMKCGKLDDPKSFALMVVKSFAMLSCEGVVVCDVDVVRVSCSLKSSLASSSLTSRMTSCSSRAKMMLGLMFIVSTRLEFILKAKI